MENIGKDLVDVLFGQRRDKGSITKVETHAKLRQDEDRALKEGGTIGGSLDTFATHAGSCATLLNGAATAAEEETPRCRTLLPGLPSDLAQCCLARVPWIHQSKLLRVCKNWAAFLRSDSIYSVRSSCRISESFLFLVTAPVRFGYSLLSVIDGSTANVAWKPLAGFPLPGRWSGYLRGFRCAVVGRYVFVIGGRHDGLTYGTGNAVLRFDFFARKWSRAASMKCSRRDFACAVIGGKIYVAGGTDSSRVLPQGSGVASAMKFAEVYLPEEDQWQWLPCMHTARVGCLGGDLNGRFYAIGGGSDHGTVNFQLFRSAEVFDPALKIWYLIDDMWQSTVQLPRAVMCHDTVLYAIDSNDEKVKSYNEKSNEWIDITTMSLPSDNCSTGNRSGVHPDSLQALGALQGDQLLFLPTIGLVRIGATGLLSHALLSIGNDKTTCESEIPEPKASVLPSSAFVGGVPESSPSLAYLIIGGGIIKI